MSPIPFRHCSNQRSKSKLSNFVAQKNLTTHEIINRRKVKLTYTATQQVLESHYVHSRQIIARGGQAKRAGSTCSECRHVERFLRSLTGLLSLGPAVDYRGARHGVWVFPCCYPR